MPLRTLTDAFARMAATTLTDRETQVLTGICDGKTTKEIAAALGLSPKTIDVHRTALYRKLGVGNIAQLMKQALVGGLYRIEGLTQYEEAPDLVDWCDALTPESC